MRSMRYEYLIDIVKVVKPETIIEIGVAKGANAAKMINAAGFNVEYIGFDVFDWSDKEWHKLVGNGKKVLDEDTIRAKLEPLCSQVDLVKGFTQETLWAKDYKADLVFIDGDHRASMIMGDHKAVEGSKVIVFDDYYTAPNGDFAPPDFGCNVLVDELDWKIITPATSKADNIRLAIWTDDKDLRNKLEEVVE
tara:strand:- start:7522 stop:8100 length:579 start_codon:yes stop_codon:yes gene_type:complete